ncbi:MAG: tRNA (cytidine(34)-2'-O)-methyltransferase [Pseudomonadales bacterium]|jgi:tRNA (cytidine/uridine-2'-O-)-methyltransferase|nr:tRNA (cytidine(34)-2'-O)-methyltransferase [Pseudomonadales bacterium]HMU90209.1 tRNA (cytidine(34)-2'-O)-methyltransferase [Pseudomonadales bacterium]HMW15336.1 tRNA (cytidine(34)-2'-O)-methyltransferase [Pseudomonadales bacterium]HMW82275.1 tRNA (cytidine(34)-2'-O)-methyltransferase [Pseudomonadales bacterium]HMY97319.1 tRNA (cytidine(34)-2'-O)-methyltransferase [Pseudomonadales bacterium]
MLHLLLHQPQIAPNTGNLIRLCANTGCQLHLIEPLGFTLDDKRLRRAGLDYHEWARVERHRDFDEFLQRLASPPRIYAFSTRAQRCYSTVSYQPDDVLLFGSETQGLPDELLARLPTQQQLRLPMQPGSRSLNLANAAAIALYEAWRQLGFNGGV